MNDPLCGEESQPFLDAARGRGMSPLDEALVILDADNSWRRFQVGYPEARQNNMAIQVFDIAPRDPGRLRYIRDEGLDRDPGSGTFRRLVEIIDQGQDLQKVWMSDTRAEIQEHTPVLTRLAGTENTPHKRVLVNGLGLGLVVHGALTFAGVEHVDVVESNIDVIDLVGPFLSKDPRVTIHEANAFSIKWPPGSRWDIVWHDIWPMINEDNLPEMDRLMAKYRNRAAWQGCWQRSGCLAMDRLFRQMKAGTLPLGRALDILGGKAPWL